MRAGSCFGAIPILADADQEAWPLRPRRRAAVRSLFRSRSAITGQQLSTKAAATIYARLAALMPGGVTPESLSALSDEQFRGVGMSRQKSAYFRDLSEKVLSGALPLDSLDRCPTTR